MSKKGCGIKMILVDDVPDFSKNTIKYPKNKPCKTMTELFDKMNGKLIVFEGIDGAGKSTQINELMSYLKNKNISTKKCSFKQSSIVYHSILKGKWENYDPYTSLLLNLASITDTLAREIIPALKRGKVVLMDRYVYSLLVRAKVRGVNDDFGHVLDVLRKPDIIIYINVDVQTALHRKKIEREEQVSYWEAGCDMELATNKIENWTKYQKMIQKEYHKIFANEEKCIWIESLDNISINKEQICNAVIRKLPNNM